MPAFLEHANYAISDPLKTAEWMKTIFGWHIRWQGDSIVGGNTVHVGTEERYVALYAPDQALANKTDSYTQVGGLNHIAVVVQDLDATEAAILKHGFKTGNHGDYEPGRRFYFHDGDAIEYEVVAYS